MGTVNNTFLDIINSVSHYINGKDADQISRPFKTEIAKVVNAAENSVVIDKPQYDFLRKTGFIDAYQISQGTSKRSLLLPNNTTIAPNTSFNTQGDAGFTTFIASKYIPGNTEVFLPKSLSVVIDTYTSTGNLNGQFDAYIVKSVSGSPTDVKYDPAEVIAYPDMSNIIAQATTVNVVNDVFDGNNTQIYDPLPNVFYEYAVNFNFPVTPTPMAAGGSYWVVVKFTSQYNNNFPSPLLNARAMNFNMGLLNNNTSLLWNTGYPSKANLITGCWNITLTLQNCEFKVKNIKLPNDCKIPLRIGAPWAGVMYLPVGADLAMYRQGNAPLGTFYVQGVDPLTGDQMITINVAINVPNIGQPLTYTINPLVAQYYIDYIAEAGQMVLDTDVPVIPRTYRDILVYKAMMLLYASNNGLALSIGTIAEEFEYYMNKLNEGCLPQESVAVGVITGRFTSNMAGTRDNTMTNSLLAMNFPNSWAQTYSSALNSGPFGGF